MPRGPLSVAEDEIDVDVGRQRKAARCDRGGGALRIGHEHVGPEAARLDVARALADILDADDALA